MPEAARQTGPALFPSGVVCDRFRIDGVLGVGGTGTVFRALDLEREEVVALKAIPHDATLRQRARREASVAGKLRHPNVVRLRSVHEDGQYVYIASDIVEGMDLAGALRQGQLGDPALLRVASAVCAGLAHAHEHGVVHRDVKPANVLLGRDGSVRVLDFGIASLDEPDATVDDRMLGTLSYMAPETCQGARPTPATDVWAVGVMVYEALTGANPFRARTPDELRERHKHPPRSLGDLRPDLPRSLAAACARALESHPRRRPSAGAFARVLSAAADAVERPAAREPRATTGGGGGGRGGERGGGRARSAPARRARAACAPAPAGACPAFRPCGRPNLELDLGGWAAAIARCGVSAPSEAVLRAFRLAAGSAVRGHRDRRGARGVPVLAARARASARLRRCRARARVAVARGGVRARGLRPGARRRLGGPRLVRRARRRRLAGRLRARRAGARCCRPSRRCSRPSSCGRSTCSRPAVCARSPGRALAGAAGPFAIALWAAVPLAGALAGTAWPRPSGSSVLSGVGAPLLLQSAAWAAAGGAPAVRPGRRRGADCSWASGWPGCWPGRSRACPGGSSTRGARSLCRGHLGRGYTAGAGRACAR